MPVPNSCARIFVEGWSPEPNPTDVPLERQILAEMLASREAMAMGCGYLRAADFTDKDTAAGFTQIIRAWNACGGESLCCAGEFGTTLKNLRRVTGRRAARALAWDIVLEAHPMTPEGWCKWATERIAELAERLRASGFEADAASMAERLPPPIAAERQGEG